MLSAIAAAVFALTAVVTPPPGPITIEVLALTGSGCRPGTATVAMSGDNEAFTVVYGDFLVQAHGPDVRKNCEISLRVNHPEGLTYGIAQTDFRGFADLGAGTRGVQRASYFWPGMAPTTHSPHTFPGPMIDNWQVTDQPNPASILHGPCRERRPLTINAELRVVGKSGQSIMSMDSTDSSVSAEFQLSWRKC